jgi:hypothetical protein
MSFPLADRKPAPMGFRLLIRPDMTEVNTKQPASNDLGFRTGRHAGPYWLFALPCLSRPTIMTRLEIAGIILYRTRPLFRNLLVFIDEFGV